MKSISLPFFILLCLGMISANSAPSETAVRWISKSKEYEAVCQQTYLSAWERIKGTAAKASKPWAVVMDIDETVLNNSQYQIELNAKNAIHSQEAWEGWIKRAEAPPVPGVRDFIKKIQALPNGRIIFLSNRYARNEGWSRRNLEKYDLLKKNDLFLLRQNKEDTKANRQREVTSGTARMAMVGKIRILAWFGDAAHDFPDDSKLLWGKQKFMLPNPVYGSW